MRDSWFDILLLLIMVAAVIYFLTRKTNSKNNKTNNSEQNNEKENVEYSRAYEPKYLMTLNEKAQFRKLQQWAQSRGLLVFTKVRLPDLIAPRKNQENYKGLFWKIQAKHVDFVICDNDIKVKCIIEISDNSHKDPKRVERDKFVTEVLNACGYKVLETYNVNDAELDIICNVNACDLTQNKEGSV